MVRIIIITCTIFVLSATQHANARTPMPAGLAASLDRAAEICLSGIAGKPARNLGQFKKSNNSFTHIFKEGQQGVLNGKVRLNGSNNPRIEVFIARDRVCSVYTVRLGGGTGAHTKQFLEGVKRRGWSYDRKTRQFQKGNQIMTFSASAPQRSREGDVLTNFSLVEWVKDEKGRLKRKY